MELSSDVTCDPVNMYSIYTHSLMRYANCIHTQYTDEMFSIM